MGSRNAITCIIAAIAVWAFPIKAIAQIAGLRASASLEATFGLDDRTRAFIQALPAEIRVQILGLLKDALPLVDESVLSYLKAVDEIMGRQINNLQCAAVGAGKILSADLKSSLPIVGGSPPTPVEDARKDRDNIVKSFSKNDSPARYREKYADLLYRLATVSCQVSVSADSKIPITEMQDGIRSRLRAWERRIEVCSDAIACTQRTYGEVYQMIAKSDHRDADAVNATSRMMAVVLPKSPGILTTWDPNPSENAMVELFAINDGIEVARKKREELATSLAKQASDSLANVKAQIAKGRSGFDPRDDKSNNAAISISNDADGKIAAARELINHAKAMSSKFATRISQLESFAQEQSKSANDFRTQAMNSKSDNMRRLLRDLRNFSMKPGLMR